MRTVPPRSPSTGIASGRRCTPLIAGTAHHVAPARHGSAALMESAAATAAERKIVRFMRIILLSGSLPGNGTKV